MIVLDASAAVDLLTERGDEGEWVASMLRREQSLGAPHLVDLEILSALRQLLARGELTVRAAKDALASAGDLGLVRYPVSGLLDRIWGLRDAMTPYDAAYVVVSEVLGVPLLTTDLRLGRTRGHRAEILAYPG